MEGQEVIFHGEQKKAVEHFTGPMMVLAGPGSGKTTVITHRIDFLIRRRGVEPGKILVITFTKAAAGEMKERFERLSGGACQAVSFGTFHAVFFNILKRAYRYEAGSIVREEQQMEVIRELMDRLGAEAEDETEYARQILSEISSVKGGMLDLEHYYAKNCSEEIFKKFYRGYEEKLNRAHKLDFDDMLVMCHQLFTERKDILQAWREKFQFILIDEFQDINRVQYEIVRMLAAPAGNLFIVGDDDQSIYRFRGAKPEIMLGFETDYPDAARTLLNVNYRSSREIVRAASNLIGHNRQRFSKNLEAQKGSGRPVDTRDWENPGKQAEQMVREFCDYVRSGYRFSDIAVLYRTNSGPRLLAEKMMEYQIPFIMRNSVPNLYRHWISRNVIAYIKISSGEPQRSDVLQIMNRPKRYLSREALDSAVVSWERVKAFYSDRDWMVNRLEQLEYDLSMIREMVPSAAVTYIRKVVGYDDFIREYAREREIDERELSEILDQLTESAAGFCSFEAWFSHMEEYERRLKQEVGKKQEDAVSLMTMHGSKGLEYPIVYIPDANEGVTPHKRSVLDADMEEERRMFYVAMTRAKERLHVYWVKERYEKKQEMSRFVREYLG